MARWRMGVFPWCRKVISCREGQFDGRIWKGGAGRRWGVWGTSLRSVVVAVGGVSGDIAGGVIVGASGGPVILDLPSWSIAVAWCSLYTYCGMYLWQLVMEGVANNVISRGGARIEVTCYALFITFPIRFRREPTTIQMRRSLLFDDWLPVSP